MDFSKYLDWIKLSPRYLLPISIFTGIVLFGPSWLLDTLGMAGVVANYRFYFGLVFLLSTVLLVSSGLVVGFEQAAHWVLDKLLLKQRRQRLHRLSEPEKQVLRGYVYKGTPTQYFSIADGVVGGLEDAGIIYKSSNVGNVKNWAYNIQPWAWEYLNSHPQLLK